DTISGRIAIDKPHNSAVSADGLTAWVGAQGTPSIVAVSLDSMTELSSVALDTAPRALDYGPGQKIYFTAVSVDAVEVLDPGAERVISRIATGVSPHAVRELPGASLELTVSQTANDLEILDPANAAIAKTVPLGKKPHWIAVTPDGRLAYITDEDSN